MDTGTSYSLAEIYEYAHCPYRHFWRYVARIVPPPTAQGLVEATMRQSLTDFYNNREGDNLLRSLAVTWQQKLLEWGCEREVWDPLVKFAVTRAELLEPFLSKRVRKPDGTPYKAPEMSAEYKRQARKAALPQMEDKLNDRLVDVPVLVDENYTVVDAFSDCVEVVTRNEWPVPEGAVMGVGLPFEVRLTDGVILQGVADLVVEVGNGKVDIEIHDYDHPVCLPTTALRRDLRVTAVSQARSERWNGVRRVLYRHLRSGTKVSIHHPPGTGRLLTAAIGAAAGIRHRVYVPRLAVQSRRCLTCPFYALCSGKHDVLDALDPTLLAEIEERA